MHGTNIKIKNWVINFRAKVKMHPRLEKVSIRQRTATTSNVQQRQRHPTQTTPFSKC